MKRERVQKQKLARDKEQVAEQALKADSKEELKAELDAMLADIDEALQGISEDFAEKYVQKGGE